MDRVITQHGSQTNNRQHPLPQTSIIIKESIDESYFDICYNQLSNILDSKITLKNIVKRISQCMKIVENFKKLNGIEKKDLVIDVMQKLIRDSDNDETIENILIDTLEAVGHPIIDTIIIASKGKFFTTLKSKFIKCFQCSN